jgi:GMP synthase-like glutamine amidotransferase
MADQLIAIIEHERGVSPGHFGAWLAARNLSATTIAIHAGAALPRSAADFAGICSLGGAMSVNDSLPWIADELALLRDAVEGGVPVIGHCLGGQMLARALGARITRSRDKEIGWLPLDVVDRTRAVEWFGAGPLPEIFQWHEDEFELPGGAARLAATASTSNQAFVATHGGVDHLGMQFHVEMTPELVIQWTADARSMAGIERERSSNTASVQSIAEIRRDLPGRCERARGVAFRLYDRWARGLVRRPRR